MFNKVKNMYTRNSIFCTVLLLVLIFELIYLSAASSNVLWKDYWIYLNDLVDKMYTHGISFHDLYYANGNHHSPVQMLLFLLNVKFFHLDPQVDIYLGAFALAALCFILYKEYYTCFISERKSFLYNIGFIGIIFIVFSLNQWEILNTQFSFSFALRAIIDMLTFVWTSHFLKQIEDNKSWVLALATLYFFVICGMSGAYFIAYGFALTIVLIVDFARRNTSEKKIYYPLYVILGFGMLIGLICYMYGFDMASTEGMMPTVGLSNITDLFKGYILMFGTSLVGTIFDDVIVVVCGVVVCIFHVYSLVLYVKKKMYVVTYFPLLLMLYSVAVILIIYLGRAGITDVSYLASSRYVMDTSWFLIADIWIQMIYFSNKQATHYNLKEKILSILICVSIIFGIMISSYAEWGIKEYQKQYTASIPEKMINIDEYTDEELTEFQAPPHLVRSGIEIMKKYKLGIFRYEE